MLKTGRLAAGVVAFTFVLAASAQDKKPLEFRYTSGAPPKTPWEMQINRFVVDLDKESGGTMKIIPFINAQLGNEQDTMQQVARGRIDTGGFSITAAALLVPELAVLSFPFLFASPAEQDCVLDNHLFKLSQDRLAKRGVVLLGWTHVGGVDVIGKKPYLAPAEVKGLKARSAPTKAAATFWSGLGANPNPIGITEWASAFQSGLVDVADAPITYYFPSGLGKVAPVITRTGHIDAPGVVVMSKSRYDKLTAPQKKVMERVTALRPASQLRAEVRGFENAIRGMHVKAGGQIVELTPEQKAAWREAMVPLYPSMLKAVGDEASAVWVAVQDGKKACKS